MTLTALHNLASDYSGISYFSSLLPNDPSPKATNYTAARNNFFKLNENSTLASGLSQNNPSSPFLNRIHDDSAGIPTIGYGFNVDAGKRRCNRNHNHRYTFRQLTL